MCACACVHVCVCACIFIFRCNVEQWLYRESATGDFDLLLGTLSARSLINIPSEIPGGFETSLRRSPRPRISWDGGIERIRGLKQAIVLSDPLSLHVSRQCKMSVCEIVGIRYIACLVSTNGTANL